MLAHQRRAVLGTGARNHHSSSGPATTSGSGSLPPGSRSLALDEKLARDLAGALLLWLPILFLASLALSSAVGAYFATAWTVAYRRFDVEGEVPEPPPAAA